MQFTKSKLYLTYVEVFKLLDYDAHYIISHAYFPNGLFFLFLYESQAYIQNSVFYYFWTNLGPLHVELYFNKVSNMYTLIHS